MAKATKRGSPFSDQQELILRDFMQACVDYNIALPSEVIAGIIYTMGYKVVEPGKLVHREKEIKSVYGDPDPFGKIEDEYGPDGDALRERLNANSESTDEASASESPEGDEVGNVLQQDV